MPRRTRRWPDWDVRVADRVFLNPSRAHAYGRESARAFVDFPRTRSFILLTLRGLSYMQRPSLHDDLVEGPRLTMSPRGVFLAPDVRRPRRQ
jgi:hypothetical protein